ncbi:sulfotransferase [Alteromonas sp. a30]|uniref:sulfotransferase n=1 Tax=Alteromonas sp. a30 TaxID=2730917 RepID=UPI00227E0245|nr:sulfotransferase [Alteromonas sp. a30]MCY7295956.1 tetratricopeptide repeat protein [Alteromonas sp. a30]
MTNSQNTFEAALAAHQKGELERALSLYSDLLTHSPNNAELLSLKGSVLSQLGQFDEAENLLKGALKLEPKEEGFWVNLATHTVRKGDPKQATSLLIENIPDGSMNEQSWQCLVSTSLASNQKEISVEALKKLLTIQFSLKRLISLSQLLVRMDKKYEAIAILEQYQAQARYDASYWHVLCWLYDAEHLWSKLSQAAQMWCTQFDTDKNGYRFLASAFFQLGRQHEAISVYEKLLSLPSNQDDVETLKDKAKYVELCVSSLALEKAQETIEQLTSVSFNAPGLFNAQAQLAIFQGDKETAKNLCLECIKQFPEYLTIFIQLVRIESGLISLSQLQLLKKAAGSDHPENDSLAFVVAHFYHDAEEYSLAYEWYQKANELRQKSNQEKGAEYNKNDAEDFFKRVLDASTSLHHKFSELFASKQYECSPIFIIGMPRSGTTLLEGMLACHPSIHKTGERIEFPNLLSSIIKGDIDEERLGTVLTSFVDEYVTKGNNQGKSCFFIDKNPANYMSVGIIRTLFPNALIINIEREPLETIFSIFRHEFSHLWSYATSLESIAHQYGVYQRFIANWRSESRHFINISYEELVKNPQSFFESLMQTLGLQGEEIDLQQGIEAQAFTTFSALQVRDKVSNFNGVAKHYLPFISNLPELESYIKGEVLS